MHSLSIDQRVKSYSFSRIVVALWSKDSGLQGNQKLLVIEY